MALTLINNNLHLSTAQLARMEQYRDNVGQHIYFKGDGIKENPFVFNMSSSISVGRPSAIAAVSMVGKNIKFVLTLCHFTQPENMHYSQSYEGEKRIAKAHVYGSDGQKNDKAVTDYVVTEGVHIVGASLERQLNLFVDDQPLLKQGQRPFGTLRKLVIEGDGLTVYEAHFSDARGARLSIFTGNGMEVPETPTLYPSTYVEFGGMPLEKKKSWIEIRPTLAQKEQKQPIYIRKQAGPATERIQVVVKFFEEHISIWTSEGVEEVEPAKHRLPRCLSIYEFILDSMLMCLPSS